MKKTIEQQVEDDEIFFCYMPWTMVYSEVDGNWQTCCHALTSELKVADNTPEQWMKSDLQNALRDEMLDPDSDRELINKVCRRCVKEENLYGESRRLRKLRSIATTEPYRTDIFKAAEKYRETGEFEFDERILETQVKVFGMECNLDCHMCHPRHSTIRQKTQLTDGMISEDIYGKIETVKKRTKLAADLDEIDIMDELKDLAPYTYNVKIIGGEPLVMKKQFEYLKMLIDTGYSKNINIKYQTNMTILGNEKHKVIDFIPHFRRFVFTASIDSMGDAIEYCRRRTKWDSVLENIKIVKKFPNVTVDCNCTMGFLSILRFYEFLEWKENTDLLAKHASVYALERPRHLQVRNLPEKIKNNLIPKYEKYPHIQKMLKQPPDEFGTPEALQQTFKYLLDQDEYYKGTKFEKNLFEVFPELEEFYIEDRNIIAKG